MKTYKYFSVIVILVLLIVATPAQAATMLTVDASTGTIDFGNACPNPTSSAVYKSLQAAINCAVDGDTIEVMNGTYGVTGQTNQDGYSTAILIKDLDDLTIQSAPGHNPVVKPATPADIVSISIEGSERLTIDNIDSDQTVAQFDNWHVFDADGLTVRNSHFEGGEDGIDFNTDLTTALIENNSFVDVNTGNGDEVLDFTDGAYADVTIQDNLFENNYRQIRIERPSGQATNFIIRRNFMDGTTSEEAIRLVGASDILVENNVIMNNMQQGVYIDSGSSYITVRHNTFFNNDQEDSGNGELRTKVTSLDIVIKNNIFYGNGSNPVFETTVSGLPGEDYNLVYNFSGSFTFGTNTITGNPLFMNTTAGSEDLHLQFGSPAIEEGVDLGVTDDIEKSSRPKPAGSDPDIGAYEFFFDDQGPITTNTMADPNPAAVGSSVTVTANVADSTTGGSNIASAEYSLDNGPWTAMSALDSAYDEVSEDVTASFVAPSEPGIYDLCVRGTDEPGNVGEPECIMFVVYDPSGGFVTGGGWIDSPEGAYHPNEYPTGENFFLDTFDADPPLSSTNVDGAWYPDRYQPASFESVVFDEDNRLHVMISAADYLPYGSSTFYNYQGRKYNLWNDVNTYITADLYIGTDWENNLRHASLWATTYDADGYISGYPIAGFTEGTGFRIYTQDTDENAGNGYQPGWYDIGYPANFEYGNWYTIRAELTETAYRYYINGELVWSDSATFDSVLWANMILQAYNYGEDYDVYWDNVGAGRIGDFPVGKATFGFVSKYKKGASVPEGNTQFQFQAGDLNFHSTSYEWLVVTGSNFAKFKGSGTINGQGDYKFQLWAGDGTSLNGLDTFRIKIWYEDNGSEVVVYDNGPDQEIGGGSIVVHKAK